MAPEFKATIEKDGCKATFEGTREFVEEQVARWSKSLSSKQLDTSTNYSNTVPNDSRQHSERELVQSKLPSGHLETVAVIAFALTASGLEEFSEEDVRRAYLRAGVRPPKVVGQALRDAKNKMDYIEAGSRRGLYRGWVA